MPAERVRPPWRTSTVTAIAAGGLAAAVAAGVLLGTSSHFVHPVAFGALVAEVTASSVAIGLVWSSRRPESRFGLLLVGFGFAYALYGLQGIDASVPYALGVFNEGLVFVFTFYLVFSFPTGRIVRRPERAVFAACVALVVGTVVPWMLVSERITGRSVLAVCHGACPPNGFLLADRPDLSASLADVVGASRAFLSVAIVLVLVYRLISSTHPQRRALLPVLVPALVYTIAFGLFGALDWQHHAAPGFREYARWASVVARGLLSFGFLAALVQARMFAGQALERMIAGLGSSRDLAPLREIVAKSLDDPPLELAFWLPGGREFAALDGQLLAPEAPGSDRVWTPIEQEGPPVVWMIHDSALLEDPELLAAATAAIRLVLDNRRLEADLYRSIEELRASRARVVSAADAERRKLERNLHDSAQQQLAALRMRVEVTRTHAGDPETLDARLVQIGTELEAALAEVRAIGQGVYPPFLEAEGLVAALRQAARRVERPVSVLGDGIQRYPEQIEAAVYFSCLEALQNAVKHGGAQVNVQVRLREDDSRLEFEVVDDGAGFEPGRAHGRGIGLYNMSDRVGAVGGSVEVRSSPGHGTTIAGWIPLTLVVGSVPPGGS